MINLNGISASKAMDTLTDQVKKMEIKLAMIAVPAVAAEEKRWEFMLVVAPLRVPGGTGSPVNPIAIF